MPVQINIINDPIYPVTYNIPSVSIGEVVTAAKFIAMINAVNAERTRRRGGISPLFPTANDIYIEAADLNAMLPVLAGITYPYTATAPTVATGEIIRAIHINAVIDDIIAAGAVCVCNCNYCACNCNYCTCDCNYACTCNCNY